MNAKDRVHLWVDNCGNMEAAEMPFYVRDYLHSETIDAVVIGCVFFVLFLICAVVATCTLRTKSKQLLSEAREFLAVMACLFATFFFVLTGTQLATALKIRYTPCTYLADSFHYKGDR